MQPFCTTAAVQRQWRLVLALVAALLSASALHAEAKFLVISSPSDAAVYAAKLPSADEHLRGHHGLSASRLIDSNVVTEPAGLAVDNYRGMLYVADPGSSAIIALEIFTRASSSAVDVDNPRTLVSGVDAYWVAVDPYGNLFFSDKSGNAIWSMSPQAINDALHSSSHEANGTVSAEVKTTHNPVQIYSAMGNVNVNTPHGVAADSADVFWANGASGTTNGVLMQGKSKPLANVSGGVLELAHIVDVAFGLCMSHTHIFFAASSGEIYALRKVGGTVVTVNSDLQAPRGCTFDGDGTVYVADRQAGQIFSFSAGGLSEGSTRKGTAVADINDAFGLAVFSGAVRHLRVGHSPAALVFLLLMARLASQ